ncbi:globin domain-containing protein [Paenibacillus eucommiae]
MEIERITLFEQMGGTPALHNLVELFYQHVLADPILKSLFPPDIKPVMIKQEQFLTQFFGGPPLYTNEYGHPRMRARHLSFPITRERADAWLACMHKALQETIQDVSLREEILERLSITAYFFVNKEE